MKSFTLVLVVALMSQHVSANRTCSRVTRPDFDERFYTLLLADLQVAVMPAVYMVHTGILAQLPLILLSCPNFCLTDYIADITPLTQARLQKANVDAIRETTQIAADAVGNSTCPYNYIGILTQITPPIITKMTSDADNAKDDVVCQTMEVLKDHCPNLNTNGIGVSLKLVLDVGFLSLAVVVPTITAKNLLMALPCGSYDIIPGLPLPSIPGLSWALPAVPVVSGVLGGLTGFLG